MKKLFQNSWQGISFAEFTHTDANKLADSEFYSKFYAAFFKKYSTPDQLEKEWLGEKRKISQLVMSRLSSKDARILSIGCGLGVVEADLIKEGFKNLEVTETTQAPLRWISQWLLPEKIHVGFFPGCLRPEDKYDYVLLSAIDYCFDEAEWVAFLKDVKKRLLPGGKYLIVSVSFRPPLSLMAAVTSYLREAKSWFLDALKVRSRGQFWGYIRSYEEHALSVRNSGCFIEVEGETEGSLYWLEAKPRPN